ncbi:MAG TPA: thiamine ABC transporter substrate-binding protein [Actinomycetales bacterium]|nr:thiamine ABC transporter substrate-binding protein [Actinomycetales bacterium]
MTPLLRTPLKTLTGILAIGALTGCSLIGSGSQDQTGSEAGAGSDEPVTITVVSHDSFNMDEQVMADFTAETGIKIEILAQEDAGSLANQLVLTKGSPIGDVIFGIDNTFASRVIDADVLDPFESDLIAADRANYEITGEGSDKLVPIDFGDVCVNVDHEWFAAQDLAEPETLEDLTNPEYKDLFVVQNPANSSPGLAFLLATIGEFGEDGWQDYWSQLKDNGVKVSNSWTDAYSVEFSGSSGAGPRPLVVSYASSPPYEVPEGAEEAPTGTLLETCFRQVEYAGILTGTDHAEEAKAVIEFFLSAEFQAAIPGEMYVYPVRSDVDLPSEWEKFAAVATDPVQVSEESIEQNREDWIKTWSEVVIG